MKDSGIYAIKNKVNGKIYIGSSKNVRFRWNRHLKKLRNTLHENHHLQNAFDKYGESQLQFKVLELVEDVSLLKIIEQRYLDEIKLLPEKYYNINYDATRINYTPEVLKKMSDVKIGKKMGKENPFYGKHHSEETKQKIREKILLQDPISIEARGKISTSSKNRWKNLIGEDRIISCDEKNYTFQNIITNEIFVGRRVDFYKKYNLRQESICRMIKFMMNGIVRKHKKWIVYDYDHKDIILKNIGLRKIFHRDKRIYTFKNIKTNEIFSVYRNDFYKKYNLNASNVDCLIKRKRQSHKNWIFYNEKY